MIQKKESTASSSQSFSFQLRKIGKEPYWAMKETISSNPSSKFPVVLSLGISQLSQKSQLPLGISRWLKAKWLYGQVEYKDTRNLEYLPLEEKKNVFFFFLYYLYLFFSIFIAVYIVLLQCCISFYCKQTESSIPIHISLLFLEFPFPTPQCIE